MMPIRDITVVRIYELLQSIAKRKTLVRDERKVACAPPARLPLDGIFAFNSAIATQRNCCSSEA